MEMTPEHKEALAKGRRETAAIKAYLTAIAPNSPGRPVSREALQNRLTKTIASLDSADDPLRRLELTQRKLDIEKELSRSEPEVDLEMLEADFVTSALSYSERKGISYTAWREIGVPAAVLRRAGIKETRRR